MAARLVITEGLAVKGRTYGLMDTFLTTVGRDIGNLVEVPDPAVSGTHCGIRCHEGRWSIKDFGSTNGTLLNGASIHDEAPLSGGDVVEIGYTTMRFELDPSGTGVQADQPPPTLKPPAPHPDMLVTQPIGRQREPTLLVTPPLDERDS